MAGSVATLRGATAAELEAMRSAYAASGMPGFWRRWIDMDLRQSGLRPDPLRLAMLWTQAGDDERALESLEQAYDERNPGLIYIQRERAFERLRSHPRFVRVVEAMSFPGTRDAARPDGGIDPGRR